MSTVKIYNCLFDLGDISIREPEWVFTTHPCFKKYKELYVDIPYPVSYDEFDRAWLNIDGHEDLLCNMLVNDGDDPALTWSDDAGKHIVRLKIVGQPTED